MAGGDAGGKTPHEVAGVDTEDVHNEDDLGLSQPDVLEIVSLIICHKYEKGETTQSNRSGGKEEWTHLLVIANDVVEVGADAG